MLVSFVSDTYNVHIDWEESKCNHARLVNVGHHAVAITLSIQISVAAIRVWSSLDSIARMIVICRHFYSHCHWL